MAREVRRLSRSGIYHVVLRGVNKQRIFEQTEDYEAFMRIMANVRTKNTKREEVDEPNYFLYAYCIMDNHVHLLIQPHQQELGEVMKRIMMTYAMYFNNTYERVGHLFQDRYKSKVVENDRYFFTVMSYIHHNPVEAGLCKHPSQYKYSSWHELEYLGHPTKEEKRYEKGQSLIVPLCCFPELMEREEIEKECQRHKREMEVWMKTQEGDKPKMKSMNVLEISPKWMREVMLSEDGKGDVRGLFAQVKQKIQGSDSELCQQIRVRLGWQTAEEKDQTIVKTILDMTGAKSISEFQQLDKPTMRSALAIMRESGIGDTKLARLTGISRGVIRRAEVAYTEDETEDKLEK